MLARPDNDVATSGTVCPGLHTFEGLTPERLFQVVWWDPAALQLRAEPPFGLRRQELIAKDVEPDVAAAGLRRYIDWRNGRDAAVAAGKIPSRQVRTVTEWAADPGHSEDSMEIEVTIETVASGANRPAGARYGTLVHASLATVPLDANATTIARVVKTQGRIVAATEDEVASATDVVRAVLAHPLLIAARAAEQGLCYRETPVTWRLETGAIVEGNVDLAYVAGEEVVVVDFKTDRELDGAIERYRRQVQIYATAVGSVLGRPARGVLMRV